MEIRSVQTLGDFAAPSRCMSKVSAVNAVQVCMAARLVLLLHPCVDRALATTLAMPQSKLKTWAAPSLSAVCAYVARYSHIAKT